MNEYKFVARLTEDTKTPIFPIQFSQLVKVFESTRKEHQRYGQSFWNTYGIPWKVFPELFYEEDEQRALQIAFSHICKYHPIFAGN